VINSTLRRLIDARTALVLDHPFFGSLALRLTFKEAPTSITKTMATDGRAIFYCPAYVDGQSDAQLQGDVAHEVMHLAMQHHTRRDNREAKRWNGACDYAINPILQAAKFEMGPDFNDPAYAGKTAEAIYDLLPAEPPPQDDQNGSGDSGEGDQQQAGGGDEPGDPNDDGTEGGNGDDTGDQDGDGGNGQPGSGLADVHGAVLDAPDPTSDAAEWQVAVKQAALAAKMMGQLPGSLAAVVEQATRAKVDWRSVLRRFVQQCAAADYSWRMPNRRYIAGGLYMPELRSESMPALVLVIDSSASTRAWQDQFCTEINSVAEECKPEAVYVIHADAEVHRVDVFQRGEQVQIGEVLGQGGTDFRPAFDYIDREQIQAACVVYLTDGDGTYPTAPPDAPTLWVMTDPGMVAPWGETVLLDE
jgi:predicted metal-dependent peptidase